MPPYLRYIITLISGVLSAVLLTGCLQKDLCRDDWDMQRVRVDFDWHLAPEAKPEGMTVYFFPLDEGGRIWRFDFTGREGGYISIPAGRYAAVSVNSDLRNVRYSVPSSPLDYFLSAIKADNSDESLSPGAVYATRLPEVAIDPGHTEVRLSPSLETFAYHILVEKLETDAPVVAARGTLFGMSAGLNLATGLGTAGVTAMTFPMEAVGDSSGIAMHGGVLAFGVPDIPNPRYLLTLILRDEGGFEAEKTFDVTAQVLSARLAGGKGVEQYVPILIDVVKAETDDFNRPATDVGMAVGVGGWGKVDVTIFSDPDN